RAICESSQRSLPKVEQSIHKTGLDSANQRNLYTKFASSRSLQPEGLPFPTCAIVRVLPSVSNWTVQRRSRAFVNSPSAHLPGADRALIMRRETEAPRRAACQVPVSSVPHVGRRRRRSKIV